MDDQLYFELSRYIRQHLLPLPDKPEETLENTLAALWCFASGRPLSVEKALSAELPELNDAQESFLRKLIEQRLSGIPLAHITGRQNFMGIELLVGPEALIPRNETEILGKAVLELIDEIVEFVDSPRVIDVCTGAGNLAVAMGLHCRSIEIIASDLSPEAVALVRRNVIFHNLAEQIRVVESDLFASFDAKNFQNSIDLITCNPPYISTAKVKTMDDEISKHEPFMAFDGGPFGIKILYRVIKEAPRLLKKTGWLAFEVGAGQGDAMVKRLKKHPYSVIRTVTDAQGEIRAILARTE